MAATSRPTSKKLSREQRREQRRRATPSDPAAAATETPPAGLGDTPELADISHAMNQADIQEGESSRPPSRTTPVVTTVVRRDAGANGDGLSDTGSDSGIMSRLFGAGQKVEDTRTGLVRYDRPPGLLRPLARREYQREQAMASIQKGFNSLGELMGDIRDGLEASVEKQGELLEQLKFLPVLAEQNAKVVEQNAESSKAFREQFGESNKLQTEAVRALQQSVRGQQEQGEQIGKLLGTMGKEARDQKRDLDDLQTRLDRMRHSDQTIADNLGAVGQAIRKVSEQSRVNGELAQRMQLAFDERTRELEARVRKQAGTSGLLLGLALLLAAVALGAVAVVGFMYLRQTGAL